MTTVDWIKYPENKPEEEGTYLVTRRKTFSKHCFFIVDMIMFFDGQFLKNDAEIIAFAEKPKAYPQGGGTE